MSAPGVTGRRTTSGVSVGRSASRSSRRILPAVPVELGGGAGVLGPVNDEQAYYAALFRVSSSSGHHLPSASTPTTPSDSIYHSPTGSMFSVSSKASSALNSTSSPVTTSTGGPDAIRQTAPGSKISSPQHYTYHFPPQHRRQPSASALTPTLAAQALESAPTQASGPASSSSPLPYRAGPSSTASCANSVHSTSTITSPTAQHYHIAEPSSTSSAVGHRTGTPPQFKDASNQHDHLDSSSSHTHSTNHPPPHSHLHSPPTQHQHSRSTHSRSDSASSTSKREAGHWRAAPPTTIHESGEQNHSLGFDSPGQQQHTSRNTTTSGDPAQSTDRMRGNPAPPPPPPPPSFAQGPLPQTPGTSVHPMPSSPSASPAQQQHPQQQQSSVFKLGASTAGGLKARSKKAPAPIRTGRSDPPPAGHEHQFKDNETGDTLDLTDTSSSRMATTAAHLQAKLGYGRPDKGAQPPMVPLKDAADLHRMQRAATDPVKANHLRGRSESGTPSSTHKGRSVTPTPNDMMQSENQARRNPPVHGNGNPGAAEREHRDYRDRREHAHGSPASRKTGKSSGSPHSISPHHRPAPPPPVPAKTRPSVDASRPPAEIINLNKMERDKEHRTMKQQSSLGIGHIAEGGKRAPVLSLKKSSGALRNLFRGKKDASSSSDSSGMGRPSVSDIMRPAAASGASHHHPSHSLHSTHSSYSYTPSSKGSVSSRRRDSPESPGDETTAAERAERFFSPPVHLRPAQPAEQQPTLTVRPPRSTSRRNQSTDLARIPTSTDAQPPPPPLQEPSMGANAAAEALTHETTMATAKDVPQNAVSPAVSDSSTSTVRQLGAPESQARQRDSHHSETHSEAQSDGTESTASWSPIARPTEALSLLQLPELDLAFDFSAFDSIGLSSPSTPRNASPVGKSAGLGASEASQPARASSVKKVTRTDSDRARRAERRRSKSVDARRPVSGDIDQSWMPPNVSKLFMPTATSVPTLTSPNKLSPVDDWFTQSQQSKLLTPKASRTVASRNTPDAPSSISPARPPRPQRSAPAPPTAPSRPTSSEPAAEMDGESTHSLGHSSTPSGCSSTQDTTSTSSPHTPEDAHSSFLSNSSPRPPALETALKPSGPSHLESPISLAPAIELDSYGGGSAQQQPSEQSSKTPTPPSTRTPEARTPVNAEARQEPPRTPERKPNKVPSGQSGPTSTVTVPPAVAAAAAAIAAVTSTSAPPPVVPTPPPDIKTTPPEDPKEPEQIPPSKAPFRARHVSRVLSHRANPITPDPSISLADLTRELERSLDRFRYPMKDGPVQGGGPERSMIIRNELLLFCSELDKRCYSRKEEGQYYDLREVCFEWGDALLYELRVEQPANERGACLEGLAAILECSALTPDALVASQTHQDAFMQLMMRVMTFVMDKLGAKGVFHNTLLFSGRFLAFAFFRVPHVGGQLVGVLQPPRGALGRFTRPHLLGKSIPPEAQPRYPAHLASLCLDDAQAYTRRLLALDPDFATLEEKEAFHFQPGNWLRRWQSDDSELFPAFYRAYHRQLASYLGPTVEYYQALNKPVPPHVLFRAPGYAHLATIFAKKCHSYILGSVNAVTTSSSNNNFDLNESAGFRGSQKPPVLETANRRLVEVLWTFASSILSVPSNGQMIEVDGSQLWGEMVDLWMKNLIAKTSLYAPKGVFCLFDMLDGIVDPVQPTSVDSPLDIPYLIGLVRTILNEAEHALTIVKVVAFVFTHWEILTVRAEDRRELCLEILLEKKLFERLLLFWSQSVRSYVLRLVVFRLGHLHTTKDDGESYEVEIESVRLLQTRLDRIKKRHDELEPGAATEEIEVETTPRTPTTVSLPRSRSTITMVTDSPQPASKAEKLLGFGFGNGNAEEKEGAKSSGTKAPWWKRTLSAKQLGKAASTKMPKTWKRGAAAEAMTAQTAAESSISSPSRTIGLPPNTSHLAPSLMPMDPPSPTSPSSGSSGNSDSQLSRRKGPPPNISTPTAPNRAGSPNGKQPEARATFQFEFELPIASPRSDAFDPVASPSSPQSRRHSQPPSPRGQTSPHMSAQFSKRSSLLPPSTANALDLMALKATPRLPPDPGYPRRLHAYAIRMLAELEDAQKEYDEWWSEWGIGKVDGAPPRLAVAWPFHEGED